MEPSSSQTDRISVLCSTTADYYSTSSGTSSPNSRRNSVSDNLVKDEMYWERRRKNNDASKRSREKRRQSDIAMEQKIANLSRENELLKSRLENRVDEPMVVEYASLPSNSASIPEQKPLLPSLPPLVPLQTPVLPSLTPQMLQLCHLQAALQQQYRPVVGPPSSLLSIGSAFTPFNKETTSVIMKTNDKEDRISPDSSSDRTNVIRKAPSPADRPQPSLLGQLLSARRTSPAVPQSRTEHISGLSSPPRPMCSKSDSESNSSFASFSPSHSSEEHEGSSAIRQALNGEQPTSYVDRRKRNNEAAKRCRANRRAVFEYRSRRVQLLEGENEQLKSEISRLKQELEHQKAMLASIPRME